MDMPWLPEGLALTLREILSVGNARPFRGYYKAVVDEVADAVASGNYTRVVELGAGSAPISRMLATDPRLAGIDLIPCDARPDIMAYRDLQRQYPERIRPESRPIDYSAPQEWPAGTLLVLSATLHHVPGKDRAAVVANLIASADGVLVAEPLRRNAVSMAFVLLSLVPALLLPLLYAARRGRLRRVLWCWLLPIAPILFVWDGIVSSLRMWTSEEWSAEAASIGREPDTREGVFTQVVRF